MAPAAHTALALCLLAACLANLPGALAAHIYTGASAGLCVA